MTTLTRPSRAVKPTRGGRPTTTPEVPLPLGPSAEDAAYEAAYQAGLEGDEVEVPRGIPFGVSMSMSQGNRAGLARFEALAAERAETIDALNDAEADAIAEEAAWLASHESGFAHCCPPQDAPGT